MQPTHDYETNHKHKYEMNNNCTHDWEDHHPR